MLLLFSAFAYAEDQIYSWTDQNGVQHFSSRPPAEGEYDFMRISKNSSTLLRQPGQNQMPGLKDSGQESPTITSPDTTVTVIDPEVVAENCERARNNIFLVNSRRRIIVNDESGGQRRLTDDERIGLMSESQNYIDENC